MLCLIFPENFAGKWGYAEITNKLIFYPEIQRYLSFYMFFFTFIHFISHFYKLHTPQSVHVTNNWSNLAIWCKENPNAKTCCTLVLKLAALNQVYSIFLQDITSPNWINPLEKGIHFSKGLLQHFKEQSGL